MEIATKSTEIIVPVVKTNISKPRKSKKDVQIDEIYPAIIPCDQTNAANKRDYETLSNIYDNSPKADSKRLKVSNVSGFKNLLGRVPKRNEVVVHTDSECQFVPKIPQAYVDKRRRDMLQDMDDD
jgi:hypothetical protein